MKIREISHIRRPVSGVWPWIATPELFSRWNPNIASIEAREEFVPGQAFTTFYLWKDKPMQCRSVVAVREEERFIELRHADCMGPGIRRDMTIIERISLRARGDDTVVTRTVSISHHGIAWPFVVIIWLISRLGQRVGPDKLKLLCEGGVLPSETTGVRPRGEGIEEIKRLREEEGLSLSEAKKRVDAGSAPGGIPVSFKRDSSGQPRSLSGSLSTKNALTFLAVVASFAWMFINLVNVAGAVIVLLNLDGYTRGTYSVAEIRHSDDHESGLMWGFTGTVNNTEERFYAPDLADGRALKYGGLRKRFPPGSQLEVWYNPKVTATLFQGRSLRVLPYTPDLSGPEGRRLAWWAVYCLLPFVLVLLVTSRLERPALRRPAS